MDRFSFIMVLLSIVVGLGVTELLSNVARQINNRVTVKHSWLQSMTVAFVFIALLQQWWEMWSLQSVETWYFPTVLLMLGGPIALYIDSHIVFPASLDSADLGEHYFKNARVIWSIGVIAVLFASLFRPISFGAPLFHPSNASSFAGFATFVVLAASRNRLLHKILLPVLLIGLLADILVFSFRI